MPCIHMHVLVFILPNLHVIARPCGRKQVPDMYYIR